MTPPVVPEPFRSQPEILLLNTYGKKNKNIIEVWRTYPRLAAKQLQ
jgi:hypothetical protein